MRITSKFPQLYLVLITLWGAFLFATPQQALAKLFRNAYVQFELPANWDCQMEGTEWVCSSKNNIDSKESIIILTAKEAGPQDSFQAYETYLKAPKQILGQAGKASKSIIKSVRQRKINDVNWVDALHLSSEIPGYYTRYLATIKDKLAILVTLSAHQKYFTKYSNDYFKAVESLRVVASKDLLSPRDLAPLRASGESIGKNVNPTLPPPTDTENALPSENEGSSSNTIFIGLGVILFAVAAYLLLKRKD